MCVQYYHQTDTYKFVLHYMNTTLTGLFTLECGMKIFSYGFRVGCSLQAMAVMAVGRSLGIDIAGDDNNLYHVYSQFRGYTTHQEQVMEAASAAFTVFFTLESLLKIGACGWRVTCNCHVSCSLYSWCRSCNGGDNLLCK